MTKIGQGGGAVGVATGTTKLSTAGTTHDGGIVQHDDALLISRSTATAKDAKVTAVATAAPKTAAVDSAHTGADTLLAKKTGPLAVTDSKGSTRTLLAHKDDKGSTKTLLDRNDTVGTKADAEVVRSLRADGGDVTGTSASADPATTPGKDEKAPAGAKAGKRDPSKETAPQKVDDPSEQAAALDAEVPAAKRKELQKQQPADNASAEDKAKYWATHNRYVDKDGTVYAAHYNPATGDLELTRGGVSKAPVFSDGEKAEVKQAQAERNKELEKAGKRQPPAHLPPDDRAAYNKSELKRTIKEREAIIARNPYEVDAAGHVYQLSVNQRTGEVERTVLPDEQTTDMRQTIHADGSRDVSSIQTGDLPAVNGGHGGRVQSSRTLHLDASGKSTGMTFQNSRDDQLGDYHTKSTSTTVEADAKGNVTGTYESDSEVDNTPGKPRSSSVSTQQTDFKDGKPVHTTAETTNTSGAPGDSTYVSQHITQNTDFDANGKPLQTSATEENVASGVDDKGHSYKQSSTSNSTAYYKDGKPYYMQSDVHENVDATDDNGNPMHVESWTNSSTYAGGKVLTFDDQGNPTNAKPDVQSTVVTTLQDPDDASKQTVIRQKSEGDGTTMHFTETDVKITDYDGDPADGKIHTQGSWSYTADQLDASGFPKDGEKGKEIDGEQVDNRSWWDKNSGWIAAGLSGLGAVLAVIPTGVTQVIGGAMLVTGAAIGISRDLPEFIDHPSWGGALALGLDGIGAVAGVGGVASGLARAGIAVEEASGVFNVTKSLLTSLPATGAMLAGGAVQVGTFADHAIHGNLTAGDWLGLATTGAVIGAARFGGSLGGASEAAIDNRIPEGTFTTDLTSAAARSALEELRALGTKMTESDIVGVGRLPNGKVVFLEKGNARAGLEHMRNKDESWRQAGYDPENIQKYVFDAITRGRAIGMIGKDRIVYEVIIDGKPRRIAVSVSDNGYIVGANPVSDGQKLKPIPGQG